MHSWIKADESRGTCSRVLSRYSMQAIAQVSQFCLPLSGPHHIMVNNIPRGVPCKCSDFGAHSPRLRPHAANGCKLNSWPSPDQNSPPRETQRECQRAYEIDSGGEGLHSSDQPPTRCRGPPHPPPGHRGCHVFVRYHWDERYITRAIMWSPVCVCVCLIHI